MAMADNGLPGDARPDSAWEHAALAWQLLDVFRRTLRAMRGGGGASGTLPSGMGGAGISGATVRQALYRVGGEDPLSGAEGAALPGLPFLSRPRVAGSGVGWQSQRGLLRESGPGRRPQWGGRRSVASRLIGDRLTDLPGDLSAGLSDGVSDGVSGGLSDGASGGAVLAGGVSARRARIRPVGMPVAPRGVVQGGGASPRRQALWRGLASGLSGPLFWPGLSGPEGTTGQAGGFAVGAGRIMQVLTGQTGGEAGPGGGAETFAQAVLRTALPGMVLSRIRAARAGDAGAGAGADGNGFSPDLPMSFPARAGEWPQAGTSEPSALLPLLPHAARAYASGMHAAVQAAMARTVPGPVATDTARGSTASRDVFAKTRVENDAFSTRTGAEARGVSVLKAQARHANMGMR